jgi:hypothetical protein
LTESVALAAALIKPLTAWSIPTVVQAPLSIMHGCLDPVVAASSTYSHVTARLQRGAGEVIEVVLGTQPLA